MKILIIDDDIEILDFLTSNLKSESFSVDTARDGNSGLYMAKNHQYDCIIMDNILPHRTGIDICKEIRKKGSVVPILMLSVQSEIDDKVDLLNAGADDYLTKPFSYKELQSRIRALIRRPKTIIDNILKVDDLIIDTNRQIVKKSGKEIYLTRKEFALIEYLVRNSDMLVTRGMLMENVWSDSIDPFSNTVETHMMNLRRKIENKGKKKIIQTIPGRGYKITSPSKIIFD